MNPIKKAAWGFLNFLRIGGPVQLAVNSIIKDYGWFQSFYTKQSVDKNGNPIPWFTYSFSKFFEPRLTKEMNVFEYGCGNSTIWFAERVKSIRSVEHAEEWVNLMSPKLPANAEIIHRDLENGYADEVTNSKTKFEVIIIDGRKRVSSTLASIPMLAENGVLIFDNANRDDYKPAFEALDKAGYRRLDFWGPVPVTSIESLTSLFYKDGNCFGV